MSPIIVGFTALGLETLMYVRRLNRYTCSSPVLPGGTLFEIGCSCVQPTRFPLSCLGAPHPFPGKPPESYPISHGPRSFGSGTHVLLPATRSFGGRVHNRLWGACEEQLDDKSAHPILAHGVCKSFPYAILWSCATDTTRI